MTLPSDHQIADVEMPIHKLRTKRIDGSRKNRLTLHIPPVPTKKALHLIRDANFTYLLLFLLVSIGMVMELPWIMFLRSVRLALHATWSAFVTMPKAAGIICEGLIHTYIHTYIHYIHYIHYIAYIAYIT